MKSNLKHKQNIFVNLKPTEADLEALSSLWNAVDTLIVHNSFIDDNPMRYNSERILFWEWAIVNIDGFDFPAPYHTASKSQSCLYTYNGAEVFLSHEVCALTTAYYYLNCLQDINRNWDTVKNAIHPFLSNSINSGIKNISSVNSDQFSKLLSSLRNELTPESWRILN